MDGKVTRIQFAPNGNCRTLRHRTGEDRVDVEFAQHGTAIIDAPLGQCFQAFDERFGFHAPVRFDDAESLTIDLTASVGVATLEFADDTPEVLLQRADQALYCAKRDGRNRVVSDAA